MMSILSSGGLCVRIHDGGSTLERSDRRADELKSGVVGEAINEWSPVAGLNGMVERVNVVFGVRHTEQLSKTAALRQADTSGSERLLGSSVAFADFIEFGISYGPSWMGEVVCEALPDCFGPASNLGPVSPKDFGLGFVESADRVGCRDALADLAKCSERDE